MDKLRLIALPQQDRKAIKPYNGTFRPNTVYQKNGDKNFPFRSLLRKVYCRAFFCSDKFIRLYYR